MQTNSTYSLPSSIALGIILMLFGGTQLRASEIELIAKTTVTETALTFAVGPAARFSNTVNGRTHQQTPLTTYRGYQYVTYFDAERRLCIGRRKLPTTKWEIIQFQDHRFNSNDSHNSSVIGICDKDGTIHLAFDHHATPLNYRVSKLGAAHQPDSVTWNAELFSEIKHSLGSVAAAEQVTYPRFFSAPNGNLMLYYRAVTSGNGDGMIEEYDGDKHDWTPGLGKFIARDIGTFTSRGNTSLCRCPYMNPLSYAGGRLHASWVWRERFERTNPDNQHDLCYAYSDDHGRTWHNSAGLLIGQTGSQFIHLDTPGLVVAEIAAHSGLTNQNAHYAYPDGSIHCVMRHNLKGSNEGRYHHHWRSSDGKWNQEVLPFSGHRPKLVGRKDRSLFLIYSDEDQDENGKLFIAQGTPNADQTGWQWQQITLPEPVSVYGDALVDLERWENEQVLSIYGQEVPSKIIETNSPEPIDGFPSPLNVVDYELTEKTSVVFRSAETRPSTAFAEQKTINPPAGRLAIVIDGNSPDPDDIGATAVMFGLLKAAGLNDRLVHLSHSCDLKPAARISAADELRRQNVLQQLCVDGVTHFGPFKNVSQYFNCRTEQSAAVNDLRDAINRSTKKNPLWIIEAGEPDVIGYALKAANPTRIRHVHVVSHHPANDNSGDFFEWQQILDFGVTEHQIGDQNVGLQTATNEWDWAKQHPNDGIKWIWKQLAYAEQDGVVKFQSGKFDCSDAGMIYWWITGADQGGNKLATPVEIAAMLQTDSVTAGEQSSDSIVDAKLVFREVDGIVAVEAEHFASQDKTEVRAWHRFSENSIPTIAPDPDPPHLNDSSGASYLEALPDSRATHDDKIKDGENYFSKPGQAGVLTYNVHFTNPGRYYVWVRHLSTGSEDNGLHVGLDGAWPESGQRWQTTKKRKWAWESRQRTAEVHAGVRFQLYLDIAKAGNHQIHFSIREDGFEFDKFVLASSRDFEPQGLGPEPIVAAGEMPETKTLSSNYTEAAIPPAVSKVQDADKVGTKFKASDSGATALAMTKPVAKPNLVFEEVDGVAAVEAEHFIAQEKEEIRAWFRFEENQEVNVKPDLDTPHLFDSSGASYLEALPDSRWSHGQTLVNGENFFDEPGLAGVLTYKVHFNHPGRYYVWVRHYSTNSEDNGLHVGLNGAWPKSGQRWQTIIKRRWAWESRQRTEEAHTGVPFELYLDIPIAGEHQIHFSIREDGLEFDKFVLASDRNYLPEGMGPDPIVKTGSAPALKTLSANYEQSDMPDAVPKPIIALPAGTVRVAAPTFDITSTNFYVDQKTWLAINPKEHKTATASAKLAAADGKYTVIFHAVGENDGESQFDIKLGDQTLGSFTCPMSIDTFELGNKFTKVFPDVQIKRGQRIEVMATIGSADGSEFSRGRWLGVTLLPQSASDEQLDSARREFEEEDK